MAPRRRVLGVRGEVVGHFLVHGMGLRGRQGCGHCT